MKNIDKVRQMTPKELITFMKSHNCHKCSYNNTNCQHDMCTDGMTKWLEQEAELTIDDVMNEFNLYCKNKKFNGDSCSTDCYYFRINNHKHWRHNECKVVYMLRNFNVIEGKITRR